MFEEGENEGLTTPLIAPIKGNEIVVLEVILMLFPEMEQVIPDGREQEAEVAEN